jgi:hypothetical protein
VSHLRAPPPVEFFNRNALIPTDRNKADFAVVDKRTNEVHPGAKGVRGLAFGEKHLAWQHRG